jgi:outer membrane protein TolC
MRAIFCIAIISIFANLTFAQENLSLSAAIDAALEHNYSIKISQLESQKSKNKVDRGYAGQLPNLSITGGYTWSFTDQELTPGSFFQNLASPQSSPSSSSMPSIEFNDVSTTQVQSAVVTRFVIYDGMRGRMRYNLFESGSHLMDIQRRSEIERTILQVTQSYAKIALLQKSLSLMQLMIDQSLERYNAMEVRREFNLVNDQQRLQALVDLMNDSTNYKTAKLEHSAAIRDLNTLIGWENKINYSVEENPTLVSMPEYDDLLLVFTQNNAELQMRMKRIEISRIEYRMSNAAYFPTLTASAQYGYQYMSATDGQFETLEQRGLTGGLTLTIPIFSGGRTKIDAQNAKSTQRQAQLQYEFAELELRTKLDNAWMRMLHLESQLKTDHSNMVVFERNFERASELFNQGVISGVDLRNAQLSLQQSKFRIAETEMNLMTTQTQILFISGGLITYR